MVRISLLSVLLLLIFGCSTPKSKYLAANYEFKDDPQNEKIVLVYQNTFSESSCLFPEFWPNPAGNINEAHGRAFLVADDVKYDIGNFENGYCPWCALKVSSNEGVSAFIKYKSFNLPKEKYNARKQLVFNLEVAFPCKEKTNW